MAQIPGTILEIPVREGDQVIQSNNFNAGTTIATIADMSKMIFEGKVDEAEVGKIEEGKEIKGHMFLVYKSDTLTEKQTNGGGGQSAPAKQEAPAEENPWA